MAFHPNSISVPQPYQTHVRVTRPSNLTTLAQYNLLIYPHLKFLFFLRIGLPKDSKCLYADIHIILHKGIGSFEP